MFTFMFRKTIVLLTLMLAADALPAIETMDGAMQLSKGNVRASVYYSDSVFGPVLRVSGTDRITVNVGSDKIQYFDYSEQTVECVSKTTLTALKVIYNPFDGLYWWTRVGSGNYDLEIPSGSVKNRLDGTDPGVMVGIGLRWQLSPDTIVTPGICLDFGINCSEYRINRFFPGSVSGPSELVAVDNRLEIVESQMTMLVSKSNIWDTRIEPYGGLNILRYYSRITDESTLAQVDGYKDSFEIFVGARLKLHPMEWLVFEMNLLQTKRLSLGLGWGF
jgi:hypothetical protein